MNPELFSGIIALLISDLFYFKLQQGFRRFGYFQAVFRQNILLLETKVLLIKSQ